MPYLKSLIELKLQSNEITDISSISGLANLITLDISNQFINLSDIKVGEKTHLTIKNCDGTTSNMEFVTGTEVYKTTNYHS